ncbi:MAG: hypothetical protein QM758_29170 [Armatimonas sp.]
MRAFSGIVGIAVGLAIVAAIGRWLGVDGYLRDSVAAGHLLDWIMGTLCFVWLLILLKAPWDLYFEAHTVAFEHERARERGIVVQEGRTEYVETVRKRLLALALGAHLLSATLAAGVAFFTHGTVGYWFAAFFLISTLFRPLLAGYAYLYSKLRALAEESRYPREDVIELRSRVQYLETERERLNESLENAIRSAAIADESRQRELSELRGRLAAIGQEFEASLSRLTDQKAVIDGLQAIARLITRSAVDARSEPSSDF